MNDSVEKYVKKTIRYYYDDGFVEIITGLLMTSVGVGLILWLALDPSPFISALLFLSILLLVIGVASLVKRLVLRLKDRITYSRSGYVSYQRNEPDKGRWFLLIVTATLFVAIFFLPEAFNQIQFFFGSMLAAVLFYLGYRLDLPRFYAAGIACFAIGVATAIWIDEEFIGTAVVLVGCGLLLLLSGGLTFAFYLRQYPEPGTDQS